MAVKDLTPEEFEPLYIVLTDLTKIRAARTMLIDVLPPDDDEDWPEMMRMVSDMMRKYEAKLRALRGDDEEDEDYEYDDEVDKTDE